MAASSGQRRCPMRTRSAACRCAGRLVGGPAAASGVRADRHAGEAASTRPRIAADGSTACPPAAAGGPPEAPPHECRCGSAAGPSRVSGSGSLRPACRCSHAPGRKQKDGFSLAFTDRAAEADKAQAARLSIKALEHVEKPEALSSSARKTQSLPRGASSRALSAIHSSATSAAIIAYTMGLGVKVPSCASRYRPAFAFSK